jgi:hypothetical protein
VVNEGSHPQCTQSEKGFILGCNVDIGKRTAFYRIQHRIWIFFLVMIFSPWELFIGPPWLERETQSRESPIPVPNPGGESEGDDRSVH